MHEWRYSVYDANFNILASNMSLHDALLFCQAIYDDSYNDPGLTLLIRRIDPNAVKEVQVNV